MERAGLLSAGSNQRNITADLKQPPVSVGDKLNPAANINRNQTRNPLVTNRVTIFTLTAAMILSRASSSLPGYHPAIRARSFRRKSTTDRNARRFGQATEAIATAPKSTLNEVHSNTVMDRAQGFPRTGPAGGRIAARPTVARPESGGTL